MTRFWRTAMEVDRRLGAVGIPYCIIKSYGGNLEYNDGNVDVVLTTPLWEVFDRAFSKDFCVSRRDRIKNRYYEQNKLMLKPSSDEFAMLHLHSNAGWHNICFVTAENIHADSVEFPLEGGSTQIVGRDTEARLFVLHIIFEQFKKNEWDGRFLTLADYEVFAKEYDIPHEQMEKIAEATGNIAMRDLRPIWRRYYRARRQDGEISLWNRFLHFGFVRVQLYRRLKKRLRGQSSAIK